MNTTVHLRYDTLPFDGSISSWLHADMTDFLNKFVMYTLGIIIIPLGIAVFFHKFTDYQFFEDWARFVIGPSSVIAGLIFSFRDVFVRRQNDSVTGFERNFKYCKWF